MRGNASRVWARLNTDNGAQSDCVLHVSAEVVGERSAGGALRKTCHQCRRRWKEGHWNDSRSEWVREEDGLTACPDCGAQRQGIDTRRTFFHIGLPNKMAGCEVRIEMGNPALNRLVEVGAALCGVKGLQEMAQGQAARGRKTLKFAAQIFDEYRAEAEKACPDVILPNGITMAHAMACVRLVRDIIGGEPPQS